LVAGLVAGHRDDVSSPFLHHLFINSQCTLYQQQEEEEELSEEDRVIKENLDLLAARAQDGDLNLAKVAVEGIGNEIRTATSSMTSVPKPLKFLKEHYVPLKNHFRSLEGNAAAAAVRGALADVLSVLAMTSAETPGSMETLKFKLVSGVKDVAGWGHEYSRHLSGEIGEAYHARMQAEEGGGSGLTEEQLTQLPDVSDLMGLVREIIPWNMAHNAEPEAVDLCLEVNRLDMILEAIDKDNAGRACLYLLSCAAYLPEPEDRTVYMCAFESYLKVNLSTDALRVALKMGDLGLMAKVMGSVQDPIEKKQLAYILGDARVWIDLTAGEAAVEDEALCEELQTIMGNVRLNERYLALARDLDVMEAKVPEDVYKSHLIDGRGTSTVDSASGNTAATYVNAFVNAGFGHDKLVTVEEEGEAGEGEGEGGNSSSIHWIFRNKSHGKMAAAASLGMIMLWDVEGGLPKVDRYLYASDTMVVSGALLAFGIIASGITDDVDPAFAVLSEYVSNDDDIVKIGAMWGLGIAYAGRAKEDVKEILIPMIGNPDVSIELASIAALSAALCYTGTADGELVEIILQSLMLRGEQELDSTHGRNIAHALGVLFLGKQEAAEATIEVAKTLPEKTSKYSCNVLDMFAYAGTGDVLKVQEFLATCGEQLEHDAESDVEPWQTAHQSVAAIAIGAIASGEELGSQMAHRALEHVLQYGGPAAKKGVPLALAILNVSNPDVAVIDTLGRLAHDTDELVVMSALISLGIVGAGTNNARLAGLLRNLSLYYSKDASILFLVRISQGLVHSGKGLLTLSPYSSSSKAMLRPAMAAIMIVMLNALDCKQTIGGKMHYLLFGLATALTPRMLLTVDESGAMLPVPVRVGDAVDVSAQAGKPKTITGFSTNDTPVLLAANQRAELATERYVSASRSPCSRPPQS
jgi:26S proteasome regulatory subunit N1